MSQAFADKKINCYDLSSLKIHISNGIYHLLLLLLELQESSKKPAKLTAWRAFCFVSIQPCQVRLLTYPITLFFWGGWGNNWLIDRDTLLTTHKNTQNTRMSLQEPSAAALVLQLFRRHAKRYCRYGRACNAVDV